MKGCLFCLGLNQTYLISIIQINKQGVFRFSITCLIPQIFTVLKMQIVCDVIFSLIRKPGSHMSPMIGESLSVIIQGENSQRILLMSNHRQ